MRTVFAAAGFSILPGMIGVVAHATGRWSVLGSAGDGSYLVASWTILIAFVVVAAPVVLAGVAAHAALRPRLLGEWRHRARREGYLSEETVEEIVRRVRRFA